MRTTRHDTTGTGMDRGERTTSTLRFRSGAAPRPGGKHGCAAPVGGGNDRATVRRAGRRLDGTPIPPEGFARTARQLARDEAARRTVGAGFAPITVERLHEAFRDWPDERAELCAWLDALLPWWTNPLCADYVAGWRAW